MPCAKFEQDGGARHGQTRTAGRHIEKSDLYTGAGISILDSAEIGEEMKETLKNALFPTGVGKRGKTEWNGRERYNFGVSREGACPFPPQNIPLFLKRDGGTGEGEQLLFP